MTDYPKPVSQDTFYKVLKEFEKKRDNLQIINSHHSPEECIIVQDGVPFVYILANEDMVPYSILRKIERYYKIPTAIFYYPGSLHI